MFQASVGHGDRIPAQDFEHGVLAFQHSRPHEEMRTQLLHVLPEAFATGTHHHDAHDPGPRLIADQPAIDPSKDLLKASGTHHDTPQSCSSGPPVDLQNRIPSLAPTGLLCWSWRVTGARRFTCIAYHKLLMNSLPDLTNSFEGASCSCHVSTSPTNSQYSLRASS